MTAGSPFDLAFDDYVIVRVQAHNAHGYGTVSPDSSGGAQIRQVPDKITDLAISDYSETHITLTWGALSAPANGNSDVLSYELYWDAGAAVTPNVQLINSLVTTYTVSGGLTADTTYQFMVRAINIYGEGTWSDIEDTKTIDVPGKPNIVSTLTSGVNVEVSFDTIDDHSNAITQIEFSVQKSDATYTDISASCVESQATILSQEYCTLAMSDIETATSLTIDDLIVFKIRAYNAKGWGAYSEPNVAGSTFEALPPAMTTFSFDASTSTNTQIVLTWSSITPGAESGGSLVSITNYLVEENTGTWGTLTTTNLATYPKTPTLGGTTYTFRISAINKYGTGTASADLVVVAGEAPDTPTVLPIVTATSVYMHIDFTAPADNNVAIDGYEIAILSLDTNYYEETTYCNGFDSTIKTDTECFIPMTVLRDSPYNLAVSTMVEVKYRAYNARGWGGWFGPNVAGDIVEGEPDQMALPTRDSLTTSSQVVVAWTALSSPENGESTITSYGVQWDQGSETWVELVGETSDYLSTSYAVSSGIVASDYYDFKVRAKNKWGWGEYSDVLTIMAAAPPSQIQSVTTAIDDATGGVTISWDLPASTNGSPITAYVIKVKDNASTYQLELSNCDGSTQTIIDDRECTIPMSIFTSTFSLAVNVLIEA